MLALRADTLSLIQGCQSARRAVSHIASALEGAMEKHTRLIAPYPTDQWGLSLSENGSANLCEAVLMYQKPCQVITMLISDYGGKKINTNLHLIELKKTVLRTLKICMQRQVVPPEAALKIQSACTLPYNSFLVVRVSAQAYLLLCRAVIEVGLMVPRRIGDVSCGENHTVWQTQRRHEEGSSHPCSL